VRISYSSSSSFGEEEVGENTLSEAPDDEDWVGLPLDLLDCLRPRELVEHTGAVDEERLEGHTLGTDFEGDDLDWVEGLKGCDVERVDGTEQEDEDEDRVGGVGVAEDGITIDNAAGLEGSSKCACGGCHAHPDERCAEEASKHELATTNLLNEVSTNDGEDKLDHGVTETDIGLADWSVDASSVKHSRQEV
jgi:hypothetical protein